ncbi:MAG TPA: hypothetical protein VFM93_00570 [Candidatus Limnocylindria bacterium]|nr:hypothetical protein [Candidatus Limnocylindria bacterium]
MSATETITCRTCGETKPVEEFDRRGDGRLKRHTLCKSCRRTYQRDRLRCADPPAPRSKRILGASTVFVCTRCLRSLPADAFPRKAKGSLFLQSWCRECFKEVNAANFQRDHERQIARIHRNKARAIAEAQEALLRYLVAHPCVDCGESDPVVLEFDHVRGRKRADVTVLVTRGSSVRTVMEEIEKCEVRCANCHRRKTARELWSAKGPYRDVTVLRGTPQ